MVSNYYDCDVVPCDYPSSFPGKGRDWQWACCYCGRLRAKERHFECRWLVSRPFMNYEF